jgi:hypothetical protein
MVILNVNYHKVLNALTHIALFLYNIDEKFDKFDEKFAKFDEYFRQKKNF